MELLFCNCMGPAEGAGTLQMTRAFERDAVDDHVVLLWSCGSAYVVQRGVRALDGTLWARGAAVLQLRVVQQRVRRLDDRMRTLRTTTGRYGTWSSGEIARIKLFWASGWVSLPTIPRWKGQGCIDDIGECILLRPYLKQVITSRPFRKTIVKPITIICETANASREWFF